MADRIIHLRRPFTHVAACAELGDLVETPDRATCAACLANHATWQLSWDAQLQHLARRRAFGRKKK